MGFNCIGGEIFFPLYLETIKLNNIMKEQLTTEQIRNKYLKLPLKTKVIILSEAIDYMQSYNGRSKIMCVALAMGYDTDGDGNYYLKNKES